MSRFKSIARDATEYVNLPIPTTLLDALNKLAADMTASFGFEIDAADVIGYMVARKPAFVNGPDPTVVLMPPAGTLGTSVPKDVQDTKWYAEAKALVVNGQWINAIKRVREAAQKDEPFATYLSLKEAKDFAAAHFSTERAAWKAANSPPF